MKGMELRLSQWLEDGPVSAPRNVVEAALAETQSIPQARVVELPWRRWPHVSLPTNEILMRSLAVAASIALVAVGLGLWSSRNSLVGPPPSASPSVSPSLNPTPTPSPSSQPPTPSSSASPKTPSSTVGELPVSLVLAGSFDDVAVAADAEGHAHVAAGYGVDGAKRGLVYLTDVSGTWTSQQITAPPVGQDDLEYDGEPSIAIDTDGSVWIAFTRYQCAGCTPTISDGIFVMSNVSGSWSQPALVDGPQSNSPSIAVSGGVAHVAYAFGQMPEQPSYPVMYATNADGTWSTLGLTAEGRNPSVVIGSDGRPHVAFTSERGIELAIVETGTSSRELVADEPLGSEAVFVRVDGAGHDVVVWRPAGEDAAHTRLRLRASDGTWGTPLELPLGTPRVQAIGVDSYGNLHLTASNLSFDTESFPVWLYKIYLADGSLDMERLEVRAEPSIGDMVVAGDQVMGVFVDQTAGQGDPGIWFGTRSALTDLRE
jgi:hypothetical protein